ncbi:MAG: hypothetical protein QOI66_4978 [Myxococcales bacterium]|nr:hypothetical protein [Myxococcales bacterium]
MVGASERVGSRDMNGTPTKAADLVTRDIAGETVIVPVRRGAVDINNLYVLNATAAYLWSQIDGKRTSADLVELLLRNFQIDRATAEADVNEFLNSLRESALTNSAPLNERSP